MSVDTTLQELQEQLLIARNRLRDVDDDIYKLPPVARGGIRGRGRGMGGPGRIFRSALGFQGGRGGRGGGFGMRQREEPLPPPYNRGPPPFNEFDDDTPEQALKSEVIAKDPSKTREEALKERSKELQKFSGSRRLFQVGLLGTLSKFREENRANEKQVKKEKEVEQKMAAAAQKEKDEVDNARRQLLFKRRAKQMEVRKIQRKMALIQAQDDWEKRNKQFMSFIQTNSKPPIFWIPKIPTEKSFDLHKVSNARLQKMITRHKKTLEEQLKKINESGTIYAEDGSKVKSDDDGEEEHEDEEEEGEDGDTNEPTAKRLKSSCAVKSVSGQQSQADDSTSAVDIDAEIGGKDVELNIEIGLDCESEQQQDVTPRVSENAVAAAAAVENDGDRVKVDGGQVVEGGGDVVAAGTEAAVVTDIGDIPLPAGGETAKTSNLNATTADKGNVDRMDE